MTDAEQAIHRDRVAQRTALAGGDTIRADALAGDIERARIIARDARAARDAAYATYNAVYQVARDRAMIPVNAALQAAYERWRDALIAAEEAIAGTLITVGNVAKGRIQHDGIPSTR